MTADLPEEVRRRAIVLAAEQLATIPLAELPGPLRQFARFTAVQRAKRGGPAIAAALESDAGFRQRVADAVRAEAAAVGAATSAGEATAQADPSLVGALAYLLRPDGWEQLVAEAGESLTAAADEAGAAALADQVGRLRTELETLRSATRERQERLRAETAAAKADATAARGELRGARQEAKAAQDAARRAETALADARRDIERVTSEAEAAGRRHRAREAELEAQVEAARRKERDTRSGDSMRLGLLLDGISKAAAGLRQELALPPTTQRPGDEVAAALGATATAPAGSSRGLAGDDPALLGALLAVPGVHLLVDGYNVTKTAYASLTLEEQRSRLVAALAGLAARTGAEVTCVFDGADGGVPVGLPQPRGVRVHFTKGGRIADEDIVAFVRAEPPGRPLVVVTSDRAVVDAVTTAGARTAPSTSLAALLNRP